MKLKQLEWLADFVFMFVFFVAGNALLKLHAASQSLLGPVLEASFAAALFSLFNYNFIPHCSVFSNEAANAYFVRRARAGGGQSSARNVVMKSHSARLESQYPHKRRPPTLA